ncbi:MAG: spore cortex biosynthesis protein YabQ [Oscillospiraceae bacterium]|nr:spore cortex biosynthesis protein YabQ [Oscillospiraceae bacterium]
MTAPALAAERFALACLLGLGLGAVYELLRPLRPRFTALADGLFLLAATAIWLHLSFAICGGDLRIAYSGGLGAGALIWEWTVGRLLRPVLEAFWRRIGKILGFLWIPAKKFSKNMKILFASVKKWVTIKSRNRRHHRRESGGSPYGRIKRTDQSLQAGSDPQQQSDQDRGDHHHHIVYGRPADASAGHDRN